MFLLYPLKATTKVFMRFKNNSEERKTPNVSRPYLRFLKCLLALLLIISVISAVSVIFRTNKNLLIGKCKPDLREPLEFLDPPSEAEEALIGFNFKPFENINYSAGYNFSGYGRYIVPNIVHLIKLKDHTVEFSELICIRSIYLHHKPDKIVIHCDCDELTGKYWPYVRAIPNLVIRKIEPPKFINGVEPGFVQHVADVVRINVLRKFGGIYLDNDVYVLKSLDPYRKYEMALCLPATVWIGNQILIAHRKSRFLAMYHASYKCYDRAEWYYNAGELPTVEILKHVPWLVQGETWRLGCEMDMISRLYGLEPFPRMMDYIAMHIFIRHRHHAPPDPVGAFNEENIKNYTRPFGELARLVIFGQREIVAQNAPILSIEQLERQKSNQ